MPIQEPSDGSGWCWHRPDASRIEAATSTCLRKHQRRPTSKITLGPYQNTLRANSTTFTSIFSSVRLLGRHVHCSYTRSCTCRHHGHRRTSHMRLCTAHKSRSHCKNPPHCIGHTPVRQHYLDKHSKQAVDACSPCLEVAPCCHVRAAAAIGIDRENELVVVVAGEIKLPAGYTIITLTT